MSIARLQSSSMHLWRKVWRIFFLPCALRWKEHPNVKSLSELPDFAIRLNHLKKLSDLPKEISQMSSMVISSHCMKRVCMQQALSSLFGEDRLRDLAHGLLTKNELLKAMIRLVPSSFLSIARVHRQIFRQRFLLITNQ